MKTLKQIDADAKAFTDPGLSMVIIVDCSGEEPKLVVRGDPIGLASGPYMALLNGDYPRLMRMAQGASRRKFKPGYRGRKIVQTAGAAAAGVNTHG